MSVSHSRSRLGNASKKARARGVPLESDPDVLQARQDLKADKLAAYIDAVVATAPPLRPDQVEALTRLFQQSTTIDSSQRSNGAGEPLPASTGERAGSEALPQVGGAVR